MKTDMTHTSNKLFREITQPSASPSPVQEAVAATGNGIDVLSQESPDRRAFFEGPFRPLVLPNPGLPRRGRLGRDIAASIARQHGGSFVIRPDGTFVLTLPDNAPNNG